MKPTAVDWATLLLEFRKSRGLKQKAAAELFGVAQSTVSRWERGPDAPSVAVRKLLLRALREERSPAQTLHWIETFRKLPTLGAVLMDGGVHHAVTAGLVEELGVPRGEIEGLSARELFGGDVPESESLLVEQGVFTGRVVSLEGCIYISVNPRIRSGIASFVHCVAWPHFTESGEVRLIMHALPVGPDRARELRARLGGLWDITFAG